MSLTSYHCSTPLYLISMQIYAKIFNQPNFLAKKCNINISKFVKSQMLIKKILVLKLKRAPRIESPTTMQTKNNYVDWTSLSRRWGSNPQHPLYKSGALPLSYIGKRELSLKPLQESCSETRTLLRLHPAASPQCLTGNSIPNQVLQARNIWLYVSQQIVSLPNLRSGDRFLNLAAPPGFEPGQTEPKPVVLPLHHRAIPYKIKTADLKFLHFSRV